MMPVAAGAAYGTRAAKTARALHRPSHANQSHTDETQTVVHEGPEAGMCTHSTHANH